MCCGSGGVGKTTTAAALALRAAERGRVGRRADHRSRSPARPVDGADRAGQRPPQGQGRRRGRRRPSRRDDARHEADVRRDRPRPLHTGARREDPGEPLLPVALVVVLRHAGVHGDGEAGPAEGQRQVGAGRRRHPADPLGARLPRRPAEPRPLPRRTAAAAAGRPGEGRRPRLHEGAVGRLPDLRPHVHQDHRSSDAAGRQPVRGRAGDDVRWLPAARRGDLPAARGAGHGVRGGVGARAGRAAGGVLLRRPAGRRTRCRWPGWC